MYNLLSNTVVSSGAIRGMATGYIGYIPSTLKRAPRASTLEDAP